MKKISIFLLAILFAGTLAAQDNNSFKLSFNHLALSVKDVNRSAEFYKTVLMLTEITNRTKIEGIRWVVLEDGRELHLISVLKENVTINKAVHMGLTTKNFDGVIKRLIDLKIPYSDWPGKADTFSIRADGVKQVYFQDPDGYWVEINNAAGNSASVEQTKNEVWQLEENYWKYVKTNDLKSYLTLWDENFIGYPSTNIIGNKDHITDWIADMYKNNKGMTFNYELTRKAENVFGDIVMVFYDATQIWTNDKNEVKKNTYKLTHTWRKTGNGWLIIGGMGANK
jgi:catechol 2,3-dioxygenase-like lactoylglutathione lyase family enzyme/ketosteroid isomerase-like protein